MRDHVRYILNLTYGAASIAGPETRSEMNSILSRMEALEKSYSARIEAIDFLITEYHHVTLENEKSAEHAMQRAADVFT